MDARDVDVDLKIELYKTKQKKNPQRGVIMTYTRLECFVSFSYSAVYLHAFVRVTHGRYDFPEWNENAKNALSRISSSFKYDRYQTIRVIVVSSGIVFG